MKVLRADKKHRGVRVFGTVTDSSNGDMSRQLFAAKERV